MLGSVAEVRPKAAKDVSMAGIVGTLGMLVEAGGCGAVLDVPPVPRPESAAMGDWLTCFPGFAARNEQAAGLRCRRGPCGAFSWSAGAERAGVER